MTNKEMQTEIKKFDTRTSAMHRVLKGEARAEEARQQRNQDRQRRENRAAETKDFDARLMNDTLTEKDLRLSPHLESSDRHFYMNALEASAKEKQDKAEDAVSLALFEKIFKNPRSINDTLIGTLVGADFSVAWPLRPGLPLLILDA